MSCGSPQFQSWSTHHPNGKYFIQKNIIHSGIVGYVLKSKELDLEHQLWPKLKQFAPLTNREQK